MNNEPKQTWEIFLSTGVAVDIEGTPYEYRTSGPTKYPENCIFIGTEVASENEAQRRADIYFLNQNITPSKVFLTSRECPNEMIILDKPYERPSLK